MSVDECVGEVGERGALVVDEHFAPVPEWVLDSPISDCALRLYAVLLRYGQTSGARMPSRKTLARRLRKASTDTVDRAMKELVAVGAVEVQRRRLDGVNQTNRYHLRTRCPDAAGRTAAATPAAAGRENTVVEAGAGATPVTPAARTSLSGPLRVAVSAPPDGGGRTGAAPDLAGAAGVAAAVRPDPEPLTQTDPPPPTPPSAPGAVSGVGERLAPLEEHRAEMLAARLGLPDLAALHALAAQCQQHRAAAGLPVGRWSLRFVLAALHAALERRWPPDQVVPTLVAVAADPETRSPMRVAEAGPWWHQPPRPPLRRTAQEESELAALEGFLADRDDRAWLQAHARQQLSAAGEPVDRLSVARRARRLADHPPFGAPRTVVRPAHMRPAGRHGHRETACSTTSTSSGRSVAP